MAERKVLLVDDNAVFRQLLAEFLRRRGYDVGEAADGLDALRVVQSLRPNLVVSDCQMPGMTGPQLVEALNQREPSLPVILISGEYPTDKSGAVAFFAKTNSIAYLAERVDQIWEAMLGQDSKDRAGHSPEEPGATGAEERDPDESPEQSSSP